MNQNKRIAKQRERRRYRVRNRLRWDAGRTTVENRRPRMNVFRSNKHMYVQIIDDEAGRVLASASTVERAFRDQQSYGGNVAAATIVGRLIGQRAVEAGIKRVAFDRREYRYHGRIAALAAAAREAGLEF
ncbi:MAG: 50S ribosomal protein L18 [Pirellulales bacterium]|nr:50S ribosomal protein L18 [Pirellulales bacterium]